MKKQGAHSGPLANTARELLHAVLVLVGTRVDFDLVTDFDKRRYRQLETGGDLGRPHDLARGVALDGRLGVDDFAHEAVWQFDRDGLAVVEHHFAGHRVFEVVERVGHAVGFDLVLLVVGIHEHVHRVGEVGVGDFLAVELNHFELVVGLVDRFRRCAGEQVLELHLHYCSVAAGLVVFGLLDHQRVAADHDDVAGAEFLSGFHAVS
ncbi:hypothetical protein SDC9_134631 [bioreactor metagenome]|uniref:NAD-specific glutamate dehydrogenase n=1 Tax=bioreactor metagenome TaxID=1076179 RepID=A0A645DG32_9ZZZZ